MTEGESKCENETDNTANNKERIVACISNSEKASSASAPVSSLMITTFDNVEDGEIISLEELVKKPSLTNSSKAKNDASSSILNSGKKLPINIYKKETKKTSLNLDVKLPVQSYLIKEFRKKSDKSTNQGDGNLNYILFIKMTLKIKKYYFNKEYPSTSSSSSSTSSQDETSTSESSDESQNDNQQHHKRKNSYQTRVKSSLIQSQKQLIDDEDEDLSEADLSNYNEIIDQLCAGDDDEEDFDDENDDEESGLNLVASLKNLNPNGMPNNQRSNLNESVGDLLANFSMNSKDFEMYRSLQAINNNNNNNHMVADENDIDEENMFAENDIENSLQKNATTEADSINFANFYLNY